MRTLLSILWAALNFSFKRVSKDFELIFLFGEKDAQDYSSTWLLRGAELSRCCRNEATVSPEDSVTWVLGCLRSSLQLDVFPKPTMVPVDLSLALLTGMQIPGGPLRSGWFGPESGSDPDGRWYRALASSVCRTHLPTDALSWWQVRQKAHPNHMEDAFPAPVIPASGTVRLILGWHIPCSEHLGAVVARGAVGLPRSPGENSRVLSRSR